MRVPKLINVEVEDKGQYKLKWLRVLGYYERTLVQVLCMPLKGNLMVLLF